MEKKYNRNHINETHITKNTLGGYTLTVIDASSKPGYCKIKINKWEKEVVYTHVKNGVIKYPFHRSVFGIGYFGEGLYTSGTKCYKTWQGMLERCYDKKCQAKHPTYKGTKVYEEWHNFQNFAKWFYKESNYQEGWALDKDLLSTNNKIYSPNTCVFIPQALNNFLTNKQNTNTSGYLGVSKVKNTTKFKAQIKKNGKVYALGVFKSKIIAHIVYLKARSDYALEWQHNMQGVLPQKVIQNIN